MKKRKILSQPVRYSDLSLEDFYEDTNEWELKAERLRTRAMRKFKQAV